MATLDMTRLQCPACQSPRLKVEVTAAGTILVDFSKTGKEAFSVGDMKYGYGPDAAVQCQECQKISTATAATCPSPFQMLKDLLGFVKNLPLETAGMEAMGQRALLIKKTESLMKEHGAKLREPL